MASVEKKIEKFIDGYTDNLKEKPFSTLVKTLIVIWIGSKVIKMLNGNKKK